MKAGFKPKLFTKKEWQNNRDSALKGSGVGKALDGWQSNCSYNLRTMTKKDVSVAFKSAKALDTALDVALKKCDKTKHANDIRGIQAYKTVISSYQKALKLTLVALDKREKLAKSLQLDAVTKDQELQKAFMVYAQKKAFIGAEFHTHLLCKKKKYAEAVKRYGDGGKGGGDYNIAWKKNKVLHNVFIAKVYEDKKDIDAAIHELESGMRQMLSDGRHYEAFAKYPTFQRILDVRFPLLDFSH